MNKRQRTARRACINHGHAWARSHPWSVATLMGRYRCTRCGRYSWLTVEQVYFGKRQRKVATGDREWTQQRIRDAVIR